MKVLVGPGLDLDNDVIAAAARDLAGPEGTVTSLRAIGVSNLSRPLSLAEVSLLREALADVETTVGYVCAGAATVTGEQASLPADCGAALVAVTDHANLTWRSPLAGPNDGRAGPRFPSMTGIYATELALARVGAREGMIVTSGVVAGVYDDGRLTAWEGEIAGEQRLVAVSAELVPVVIVAAHRGLRVAAVVVTVWSEQKEKCSGRP